MKAKLYRIAIVLAFLSVYGSGTAKEGKKLTITGKVVDYQAKPVEGAEVAIYEEFFNFSTDQYYPKLLDKIKETDASGTFVLNANIHSWYRVFIVARKEGLALGWDVLTQGVRKRADNNYIILEKPSVLAGVVADVNGNPIAGAKIRALPKTSYLRRLEQSPILAPEQWFTTQTDDNGTFRFDNFAADVSSDFWVEAPGWASVYQYTTHWTSSCGFEAGRTDIRLVLPREVAFRGRVIDAESGKPVANAHVLIKPDSIREHANPYSPNHTISGQDGKFYFKGVPHGKHYINVSVPRETTELVDKRVKFDVQAGQNSKEIIVALDKGGLIKIIAREEETNKPVSNLPIRLWQAIQDEQSNFYKWSTTGKDGILKVWAPPGECAFYARYNRYFVQTYEGQVLVAKGQTAKSEIVLDVQPSVLGVVLDETGLPAPGVLVKVLPAGEQVLTDKAGKFEAAFDPSIPCGSLLARHTERNLAAIVDVKDYSRPNQITLKPAFSITSKVTDPDGVGIPAARLALSLRTSMLITFGPEMITDSQGRYNIKAVPPVQEGSEYRISVNSSGYGIKMFEKISITGEVGTEVKMKPLVLQPADLSISGVVVDAEGKPAAGVPIFLHGRDQPGRSTATDENGRFTIKRICKGQLRLQANFDSSPGGSGFLEAQGGDKDVKIILGQEGIHKPHVSLVDKPLPDLKDLKVDLSPADTDDKMLLVCFWDMQQRPSRNCIIRLAKQAEQLKNEGVTIIAVQSSKIDEKTLDEWVKENNVPFPVGMIQGNEEKTRFTWGVKSLPWLILTDKKHIVQAEGFGINELDEKITTLREK